jgi:hypothetical protein
MSGSVLCFADGEPDIHRTSMLRSSGCGMPGYRRGMPATIPSHQAPVLALKLSRPGLATVRHPLMVTLYSAFLGALSHQLWDAVTYPYVLIADPFLGPDTRLPGMHATAFAGLPWWRVIHLASELVGAASAALFAIHIGRRHLLREWHGSAPIVPRRSGVFWPVAAGLGLVLGAIGAVLPRNNLVNVAGARIIIAVTVALLGAAGVVAIASRDRQGGCGEFG